MRPARFQEFAVKALAQAPDIRTVEPWNEGTRRPSGLKIEFTTGAQIWTGITYARADGEKFEDADGNPVDEAPVDGEPPAEVSLPELVQGGKIPVKGAELYLVGALINSRNPEIAEAYGYSHGTSPTMYPGFGVNFHNGSRIFCVFEYALRSGQERPSGSRELPEAV
ncbi:hypothetical protein [Streptomyces sp. NPDC053048]|uniref:hypothetical protein n=1 Tax=Streptomyces sp. NPDC053048 TaxID=3365694 RepID=UPI0037D7ABF3